MSAPSQPPQPPKSRTKSKTSETEQPKATSTNTNASRNTKPSIFARYNALSLKVKLYIWITTAGVAWLADSVSDRIFEQNMIDAEAERRVENELRKLKEGQFNDQVRN